MAPNHLDMDVYSKFSYRSKVLQGDEHSNFKRISDGWLDETSSRKRRKTSECSVTTQEPGSPMTNIIEAVESLTTDPTLTSDGSRACCLPTVAGKHRDLNSITPETMSDILKGQYQTGIDHVTIIDCRYPYEYDGGHIEGAINLYTKDSIQTFIDQSQVTSGQVHLLIFHCEFSSERGPKMYRFLRSLDRDINKDHYPRLNFPEVYLLEGGYKAFYQKYETLCEPQAYLPMLHENHGKDLRHFRVKSKSWAAGDKPRPRFRAENVGKKLF